MRSGLAGGPDVAQHTAAYQPADQANSIPVGEPPSAGVVGAEDARFRYQAAVAARQGSRRNPTPVWLRRAERRPETPAVGDVLQTVFGLPKAADQAIDQRRFIPLKQAKLCRPNGGGLGLSRGISRAAAQRYHAAEKAIVLGIVRPRPPVSAGGAAMVMACRSENWYCPRYLFSSAMLCILRHSLCSRAKPNSSPHAPLKHVLPPMGLAPKTQLAEQRGGAKITGVHHRGNAVPPAARTAGR